MEDTFLLSHYGKQLWTRQTAQGVRGDLYAALARLASGDTLVIDVRGVEVFDYSFANELFGKTVLSLPTDFPGRFVVVEHLSPDTREDLNQALESLGLAMIERRGRKVSLLGKVHPADQATFAAVMRAGNAITAATLAEELAVNLTAINERLAKLTKLGLVRRERGLSAAGREHYLYTALR
jgi:uncharacterized protein DUF4325